MALDRKHCEPCKVGAPPLNRAECEEFLQALPQWKLVEDATAIERKFSWKNFAEALLAFRTGRNTNGL